MPAVTDLMQPFQLGAGVVRGRLIRLGPSLGSILAAHDYPPAVAGLVGQTAALAAALAGALKFDGIFTLQAQGDGPVPLLFADVTSAGHMRAYARFDADRIPDELASDPNPADPVARLLGKGHLAFTIDQGPDTDRYQGIVELVGPTLADSAHLYFRQSEQLDTELRLTSARSPDGSWRAGALMASRMPAGNNGSPILTADESEDAWLRCALLMGTLTDGELISDEISADTVLFRLFHQEQLERFEPRPLEAKCRCSRDRISSTLRSLPRLEIENLADDDGLVSITCEFCQTTYPFTADDLEMVYMPPLTRRD